MHMELGQGFQPIDILGRVSVGVAVIDATTFRIRYVNSYLRSLLEEPWSYQDVVGHSVEEVVPDEMCRIMLPLLHHVASTRKSLHYSTVPYEGFLEARGRTYWKIGIELSSAHNSHHDQENALLALVEDVTDKVRSRLHFNAIHYISSAIAGALAFPHVLDRVLQAVHEMVGSTRCAILLTEQSTSEDEVRTPMKELYRSTPDEVRTATIAAQRGVHLSSQDWHPVVSEHMLLGRVMRERRTLIITDTNTVPDLEFPLLNDNGKPSRPGSALCVPIFELQPTGSASSPATMDEKETTSAYGAVLGTIEVYHKRARGFPAEEVELLEQFALQVGLAIQNARLFREQAAARERIEAEVVARTKELAQRNEALQLAQQAQEDLVTTMAHELKTPLANIRAHLSALLAQDLEWSTEKQHDFLQTADEQVERLVGMVNQFLDASRVEAGALRLQLEPVLLPELLEDLQERLEALITSSQRTLQLVLPPQLPAVLADYELIVSVLTNLLSNAFRYALEGDTVQLKAELVCSLHTMQPSGVTLSVADRGPGMTQEQQKALFTRFSTFAAMTRPAVDRPGQPTLERRRGTARWSPATGLGLYISRGIIEAHGARLMLVSSPGQGTTFSFTLPIFASKS